MGKKHQKHLPENATPVENAELACRETGLPATRTALARVTQLVDAGALFENIAAEFGENNRAAALAAYDAVRL